MSTTITNRLRALLMSLAGLAAVGASQASVSITSTAIFNSMTSDYTYSYSVQNLGAADDLVLITFPAMFSPIGVTSIMAPTGFTLTADPSQMQINLFEDGNIVTPETFAPMSTVGTFSFRSPLAPGMVSFSAFDASGSEFNGLVSSPVPEPSAMLLLGGLAVAGATRRRRI